MRWKFPLKREFPIQLFRNLSWGTLQKIGSYLAASVERVAIAADYHRKADRLEVRELEPRNHVWPLNLKCNYRNSNFRSVYRGPMRSVCECSEARGAKNYPCLNTSKMYYKKCYKMHIQMAFNALIYMKI